MEYNKLRVLLALLIFNQIHSWFLNYPLIDSNKQSIFDFKVKDIKGSDFDMSSLRGKSAYLIVNVASGCGLTECNYAELSTLYDRYASKGLEIIAFPCNHFFYLLFQFIFFNHLGNNFLFQESGTNDEILEFALSKGAKFPLMAKVDCGNTDAAEPIFPFLCNKLPSTGILSSVVGGGVKWNFTKFLCDRNGVPIRRYEPKTNPLAFEKDIIALLENVSKI